MVAKQDTAAPRIEGAAMMDGWAGFVRVPAGKGCVLILTVSEYQRGIKRGKWLRRREAMSKREAGGR